MTKQEMKMSLALSLTMFALGMVGCGKQSASSATGDISSSGMVAGAVGGALSGSSSNGSLASMDLKQSPTVFYQLKSFLNPIQTVEAAASCPTFRSTGTSCTASGSEMWLSYSNCSFSGAANWNGVQALTMNTGSASCGTFPNPGTSGILTRQFVQSAGSNTPGSVVLTAGGYTGTVDDASTNLANYDGVTIGTVANGGYGTSVTFGGSGGSRSSITLAHHIAVSGIFDHSVSGTLSISETAGAASRTISGSVTVYHNILKVIGTSTFINVIHQDTCCYPTSGTISTVFTSGASVGNHVSPTILGALAVGKTETLNFTGCGTATLTNYDGTSQNVTLNRCF